MAVMRISLLKLGRCGCFLYEGSNGVLVLSIVCRAVSCPSGIYTRTVCSLN